MEWLTFVKLFIIIFMLFLIIDGIWLGIITKNFYKNEMKSVGDFDEKGSFKTNWASVVIIYIILTLGIIFLVDPVLKSGWFDYRIMLRGMVFGLVAYGVYDFTNHALLKDWSLKLTLIDLTWGITICTTVSLLAAIINKI